MIFESKLKIINDKLDALFNITLDSPPTSTPEAPIKGNETDVIGCSEGSPDTKATSTLEVPIKENESETLVCSEGSPGTEAVSSNSIRFCLDKYTYIWETNGRNYWAFLLNVDRRSVSGYRWLGRRWVYFGVDLRRIDSFVCYK